MGKFKCNNHACSKGGWGSKKVAIMIRGYPGNGYSAVVFNQCCKACNQLGTLELDEKSYIDRVTYRLKKFGEVSLRACVHRHHYVDVFDPGCVVPSHFLFQEPLHTRVETIFPVGAWSHHDIRFRVFERQHLIHNDLPFDRVVEANRWVLVVGVIPIPPMRLEKS